MKATCIIGSARSSGSCGYLIDMMIKGMSEAGIMVKKYSISEQDIHYCIGCKKCYVDGRCVIEDDVYGIVSDLMDSDIAVIAAPSYWAGVPAQLKTFFDRSTPYGDTNPMRILKAKHSIRGIAIAVRAGVRQAENDLILDSIEHYFGHLEIKTVKRISVCETDTLDDLLEKHQYIIEELYKLGKSANLL